MQPFRRHDFLKLIFPTETKEHQYYLTNIKQMPVNEALDALNENQGTEFCRLFSLQYRMAFWEYRKKGVVSVRLAWFKLMA